MPDGEFFTGPIEDSVEGEVSFHLPAVIGGREVAGVRLRFEAGKVVDASAERGEEFLIKMLDTDDGARRLGELGIGTNYGIDRGTRDVLLDEKIGGTVHLAVGASYPESGGTNESAVHTDMVCDLRRGGKIRSTASCFRRTAASSSERPEGAATSAPQGCSHPCASRPRPCARAQGGFVCGAVSGMPTWCRDRTVRSRHFGVCARATGR